MSLLLTFFGTLLFLASLTGVGLGLFAATRHITRGSGLFFALWWTPAAAASAGVMMHDPVTFFIGLFCFAVAGGALYLEGHAGRPLQKQPVGSPELSERTTQERVQVKAQQQRKAAS